ncbi:hypothetical protein HYQ46_010371 [Verticillium longisporum]|nr:hypothetical protein HYQ46_010371 [Verticillium longisporum]
MSIVVLESRRLRRRDGGSDDNFVSKAQQQQALTGRKGTTVLETQKTGFQKEKGGGERRIGWGYLEI